MVEVAQYIGGLFAALIAIAAFFFQAALLAGATRRILGVRIGLVRTFFMSAIMLLSLDATLRWLLADPAYVDYLRDNPGPFVAFCIVGLLWFVAIAVALMVVLEILVPTGSLPSPGQLFFGSKGRIRRMKRQLVILGIAARHGLSSQLRGFATSELTTTEELAKSLREALSDAGVTFIKLGQMLSTRSDVLPEPFIRQLATLQNRAEPVEWDVISTAIEDSVGAPIDDVFATIDPDPIASASLAQVHRATLPDGRNVVVKVQRPGARSQVETDLDILRSLTLQLGQNSAWATRIGLDGLVAGFSASLLEELDYRIEASNTRAIQQATAGDEILAPSVDLDLSSDTVLVMEFLDGTALSQSDEILSLIPAERRVEMAQRVLSAVLNQILSVGVFHADLHAGNIMIWPDGKVGFLDFGSVGRLDAASRAQLLQLLLAIESQNSQSAMDALMLLLDSPSELNEQALERELGTLISQVNSGYGSMELFGSLTRIVAKYGFGVPPMLAAALRCLGALEGTLLLLDPNIDLVGQARSIGKDSVANVSLQQLKDEVTNRLVQLLPLLDRIPRSLARVSDDLDQGRFTINSRIVSHKDDQAFLTGLVEQLAGAFLAAAALIGGILLMVNDKAVQVLPGFGMLSVFGSILAVVGIILALRVIVRMFYRR